MTTQPTIENLMENVIPVTESGCWLWTGETQDEYGHLIIDGEDLLADRVSWEVHHGSIPNGQCVCHKCTVRSCVNPDHLFLSDSKNQL